MKSYINTSPGDVVQLQIGIDVQLEANGTVNVVASQFPNPYDGYTRLGLRTFTVEVPTREELLPSAIAALREAQKRIQTEAGARTNEIEKHIQKLLAITHSPTQEAL